MAATAKTFLASLTAEQRQEVVFPLEDQERFFWHYIPTDDIPGRYGRPRKGLTFKQMTAQQRHLASALLSAGLSQQGYIKTTTIMSLEEVLKVLEKDVKGRRDPDRYHFSLFGEPSEQGTWAYRVEGHHVSLHFTVVKGHAVGNPTFLGSNPAEVRSGPLTGTRALGAEEDKGRAVLESLTPEQRKVAVVTEKAPADILTEQSRKAALTGQPNGLSAAKMTPVQRKALEALMMEYAENLPAELAAQRVEKIRKAGTNVWFAWAGVAEKGGPHYYRVQTSTFLIEYDNTQNGANHIHSVWRDFEGDFGLDLLKQHYSSAPSAHGHDAARGRN
jgi:hypothetical protein